MAGAGYDFKTIRRRGKLYTSFKLDGVNDLVNDLHHMAGDLVAEEGKKAVANAVRPIAARIQANAPRGTGLLAGGVRTTKGRRDKRGVVAAALVGYPRRRTGGGKPRAAYALQIEYGAQGKPARPFVRPAFDGYETNIAEDVRRHLRLRVIRWRFNKSVGR